MTAIATLNPTFEDRTSIETTKIQSTSSSGLVDRQDLSNTPRSDRDDKLRQSEKGILDLFLKLGNEVGSAHIERTLQDLMKFSTPDECYTHDDCHYRRLRYDDDTDEVHELNIFRQSGMSLLSVNESLEDDDDEDDNDLVTMMETAEQECKIEEDEEESTNSNYAVRLRLSRSKAKRASVGQGFEIDPFFCDSSSDDSESTFLTRCRSAEETNQAPEVKNLDESFIRKSRSSEDEKIPYDYPQLDPWSTTTVNAPPFLILGTSDQYESAHSCVLTHPLMESLQLHLPLTKQGENFWLKYSLVRDGASSQTFLQRIQGSKYILLVIETVDGEVFGAFTSEPWKMQHKCFGNNGESFVWRLKSPKSLERKCAAEDFIRRGRDIEVFKYSHIENSAMTQICNNDRIAVGGGTPTTPRQVQGDDEMNFAKPSQFGFALSFDDNNGMLEVTSSPCITFDSPSLSRVHSDGSRMEVVNIEAWTTTPFRDVKDAEVMEMRCPISP